MLQRWYAARVLSGLEITAAHAVDSALSRAFCPVERRRWVSRGVVYERAVPVMTGYVFVEMVPGDPRRWHDVAEQPGFLGFIGGASPYPARRGAIEDLLIRSTEDWFLEFEEQAENVELFHRGDHVRVTNGVLSGMTGQIQWPPDAGAQTVQIIIRGLFRNEIRTGVPVAMLEKVSRPKDLARPRTFADLPVRRPTVQAADLAAPVSSVLSLVSLN